MFCSRIGTCSWAAPVPGPFLRREELVFLHSVNTYLCSSSSGLGIFHLLEYRVIRRARKLLPLGADREKGGHRENGQRWQVLWGK
jgi:hypothetical protein